MRRLAALLVVVALALPSGASAATGDVTLPLCSAAVHDQYKVQGPDGQMYATWHPQIDHYSNCHFDHEHGSNPALVGPVSWPYGASLLPAFGYSVTKHGMTEGHAGFKVHVLRLQGVTWMITMHFGTANPQIAACERFHTFDLVMVDDAGTLKADLHLMGDYGQSQFNETNGPLAPTACPNQGSVAGSTGARLLPVDDGSPIAYEPWRLDSRELPAVGFRSGGLTINTNDTQKACNAIVCDSGVQLYVIPNEPNRGANRFITFNNGGANGPFRISGAVSGTFYTDPLGQQTLQSNDPHAVKQYIAPGFSITVATPVPHCRLSISTGTDGMFWCSAVLPGEVITKLNRLVTGPN